MRAEGGERIFFFRIFGTEERQVNEMDIFVRHATRAITGGGVVQAYQPNNTIIYRN